MLLNCDCGNELKMAIEVHRNKCYQCLKEEQERINFSEKLRETKSALETQVGGNHYKDMPIQPIEFTHKNNLNFCQGNIIKYVTRYKNKNGIEDLKKVKHYAELLAQLEYGEKI